MSPKNTITKAMVLAAGFGLRMRPITLKTPKPLIRVSDRTLLDWALDRLEAAGVTDAVVNVHHLGEQIIEHVKSRSSPSIEISQEDEILETGGGVKKALPLLGSDAFYVANADVLWLNGQCDAIQRLADMWDDDTMDGLLLLHPTVDAYGYDGVGDFILDQEGRVERRAELEVSAYLFTGVQILHPRLFEGAPDGPFSLNVLYDKAIASGRLHAIVHDGEWFHIGTPDGLDEAERFMGVRYSGAKKRGFS